MLPVSPPSHNGHSLKVTKSLPPDDEQLRLVRPLLGFSAGTGRQPAGRFMDFRCRSPGAADINTKENNSPIRAGARVAGRARDPLIMRRRLRLAEEGVR